ncbi:hypothetical protein [Microbacterium sp.]|uniref:hypothetical protein n=1 Tax=Microbacterium sp. TaxID=51671 RepID=UPI002E331A76|nr:hypothetical protein [Microbacterium sp.]HEX5730982.1 hypothetical protein [Microbacterium sp.]
MSSVIAQDEPGDYELRIGRHLEDRWAGWFGDLTMTREPDGTTTLRGPVADQAALHGILIKIRDLGVVLLAVRAIDANPSTTTDTTGRTTVSWTDGDL